MSDVERNLQALNEVYEAAARLAQQGLANDADGNRGVNAEGFQAIGDLAAVLMLQGQNGSHAEQVLSVACRAVLSALSAVAAEGAGREMQVRMQLAEASALLEDASALARLGR